MFADNVVKSSRAAIGLCVLFATLASVHLCMGEQVQTKAKEISPVELAKDLLSRNRYEDAEKILVEWLLKNPVSTETPIALDRMGKALVGQHRIDDALRTFEKIMSRYPNTELAAESIAQLISINVQKRNSKAARLLRDELLNRYPKCPATVQA